MALSNTNRSFGSITKIFHWLTALLILTIIPIGLIANDLARDIRNPAIHPRLLAVLAAQNSWCDDLFCRSRAHYLGCYPTQTGLS